jgi:alkylation response protein AidB-like acyl-CoA dehydrogenase
VSAYVPTDDQRLLQSEVLRMLTAERPFRPRAATDPVDDDVWAEAAGLGWPAALVPESAGGIGGLAEAALLAEAFGRSARPEPIEVIGAIAHVAARCGRAQALVEGIISGEARPALGPEPMLTAAPADGSWRVSGTADLLLGLTGATETWAAARGPDGVVLARIAHAAPGVRLLRRPAFDGREVATLELAEIVLPADDVVGNAPALLAETWSAPSSWPATTSARAASSGRSSPPSRSCSTRSPTCTSRSSSPARWWPWASRPCSTPRRPEIASASPRR